jgi:hypothetical protein
MGCFPLYIVRGLGPLFYMMLGPRLRLRQAMNCVTLPQLSSAEAVRVPLLTLREGGTAGSLSIMVMIHFF